MADHIKLKSGREVYANNRIIGIAPNLSITEGYDGGITSMPDEYCDRHDWNDLSPDDVCELADIAIDRWQRLKALVTAIHDKEPAQ